MTDRLTEAYRLLGNDIPPGLGYHGTISGVTIWGVGSSMVPDAVAEWGLIVAVEGVLVLNGWTHRGCHFWYATDRDSEDGVGIYDPDRLTAAILALRAERG